MSVLELLEIGFLQRAVVAGLVIGVIAPMIGMFLVTRRYAFLADTLAHVSLAGAAVGFLFSFQPVVIAAIASAATALAVDRLRGVRWLSGETALALVLYGSLGLASVLLSLVRGPSMNLSGLLFGSIVTVTPQDLVLIILLGCVVLFALIVLYRPLLALSYDEEWALSSGVRIKLLNTILIVLAAVTVALCMRIVGVLLVGALMVIPVTAALQLRMSFKATFVASLLISLLCVLGGIALAFVLGWPSGGTIVLLAVACFTVTALVRLVTSR